MERIAVLGGTFNPVHIEHISLIKESVRELNLDRLIIVPTFTPPHKDTTPIDAVHRINMLKIATKNIDKVEISDFEISNGGKSYTFVTAEHFRETYPKAKIFFIVGADMLKDFKTWKNPERILKALDLAAFNREGYFVEHKKLHKYFSDTFNKDYLQMNFTGKHCSSTKIRTYASLNLPIGDLTCREVAKYIKENNLYGGDEYTEFIIKNLKPERVVHTANVIVTAQEKTKELGLSEKDVRLAALLHDSAKYLDYRNYSDFKLPKDVPPPVIHSFLGAYVAEKVLGIENSEILDAIKYHTSGKPNMTTLGKLIFVADMIEEGRNYEGVDKLREIYKKDFEECFKECVKEEVLHLINKGNFIYEETLKCYDYYVKKEG